MPLRALAMLRKELGEEAAVCGKVFGGWTQAYHYFGLEEFLIKTITEPDEVKRILEKLVPVTIQFARAQLDAGADCLLARAGLPHPRHDGSVLGQLPGLSLRPIRRREP